jgi:hypothetical protein
MFYCECKRCSDCVIDDSPILGNIDDRSKKELCSFLFPTQYHKKQLWYLDPENWQMNCKVMYDREGKLLKIYEMYYDEVSGYEGEKASTIIADMITDKRRKHGGISVRANEFTGKPIPEEIFRLQNMQKFGY